MFVLNLRSTEFGLHIVVLELLVVSSSTTRTTSLLLGDNTDDGEEDQNTNDDTNDGTDAEAAGGGADAQTVVVGVEGLRANIDVFTDDPVGCDGQGDEVAESGVVDSDRHGPVGGVSVGSVDLGGEVDELLSLVSGLSGLEVGSGENEGSDQVLGVPSEDEVFEVTTSGVLGDGSIESVGELSSGDVDGEGSDAESGVSAILSAVGVGGSVGGALIDGVGVG